MRGTTLPAPEDSESTLQEKTSVQSKNTEKRNLFITEFYFEFGDFTMEFWNEYGYSDSIHIKVLSASSPKTIPAFFKSLYFERYLIFTQG